MSKYDVTIIGGGLVGAGFAVALKNAGLQIALIDAKLPSSNDPRLFALSNGSCTFLENLGLWPKLASYAAPMHQVHVSHRGRFGAVRLNREDVRLPSLGHVVPARYIEAALNEELLTLPQFTLYRPAKLKSLTQSNDSVQLSLETAEGEKELSSKIVIGADGTESTVRALVNIPVKTFDYEQSALVTRTQLARPHEYVAYERFVDHGAIAMLPLFDGERASIWTADHAFINKLKAMSETEFLQTLQHQFGYRLGRLTKISERHVFPLRMVRAEKPYAGNVFLLGNSAHTLHPIAAQGFNLALYEVAALVDGILQKTKQNQAISAHDLKQIYDQTQKQQAMSIGVSHRLSNIFSKQSALIGTVMQLGMIGFELVPSIKKKFIAEIMGRSGRVPSLLLSNRE